MFDLQFGSLQIDFHEIADKSVNYEINDFEIKADTNRYNFSITICRLP